MGCVSSKESMTPTATVSSCWYPNCRPCCCCTSPSACQLPAAVFNQESRHVVSLTFSSYGVLSMERPPCHGSFLGFHNKTKIGYPAIVSSSTLDRRDDLVFGQGLDMKHLVECIGMKPKIEEQEEDTLSLNGNGREQDMETINTHELMEDFDELDGRIRAQYNGYGGQKLQRVLNTSLSFKSLQLDAAPVGEIGSSLWKRKYYTQSEMPKEVSAAVGGILPLRPPSSSPSTNSCCESSLLCNAYVESTRRPPRNNLIDRYDSSGSCISSKEDVDEDTTGLKFLLSPVHPPPDHASQFVKNAGFHTTSLSFDGNAGHLQKKGSINWSSSDIRKRRFSWQLGKASSMGSDIPSFDPTVLATAEQAVMAMSTRPEDDWLQHGADESTTSSPSSDSTWASTARASDAESIPLWSHQDKHSSTPSLILANEEVINNKGLLASYPVKCPPRGDGKVVLYHTSMRGIRRTYEDCCTVRLIVKGLGIHVDERDVWMDSKFREELVHTLGDDVGKVVPLLPCLFIKGSYIGGAEEVKQLHEDGRLSSLTESVAMDSGHRVCDGCGDVRFVPCVNCNGSCKVLNHHTREVTRCLICNENGLIMCPLCTV